MTERQEGKAKKVLYIIVCGTEYAARVYQCIEMAQAQDWDTCVILTPMATRFVDVPRLRAQTGHPVRSEYRRPEDPDVLPKADMILVFGATFNTINKWALGISDNLALGILCEWTGLKRPIVAVPVVRKGGGLDAHPAFLKSLWRLRRYGVHVLYDPETYAPRNEMPVEVIFEALAKILK